MSNRVLQDVQPIEVLKYFEELSQIPRGSGDEKRVSDYLVSFAKEHNFEVIQDEALNVVIKKKATPGYENSPTVIIQGHMDMVCEKNVGTEHDFTKDPLKLRVVDDMLYATGTTLGGDNGIAVAMGLALLDSKDIPHPAIELLVTTAEETGMDGAMAFDPKNVNGRTLINIDSEEEGTLLVSCAGGLTAKINIPITWEDADKNMTAFSLRIRGLKGGHSGMEINKGRANSNKLMARMLRQLNSKIDFRIASINGGSKHNAIPREMDVVMFIKAEDKALVQETVSNLEAIFKNEFRTPDPDLRIEFEALSEVPAKVMSKETSDKVITFTYLIPNAVQSMSMDIEGLVESSLNLGVVATKEDTVECISAVRSSVRSLKENLFNNIVAIADLTGAKVTAESDYPEWEYNPESKIRNTFIDVYEKMYGKKPIINAIHAGLECGLFGEKFDGQLDMISFGPNMYDVHTPDEHLSISSTKRTWEYLLEVLKSFK